MFFDKQNDRLFSTKGIKHIIERPFIVYYHLQHALSYHLPRYFCFHFLLTYNSLYPYSIGVRSL